MSKLSSIGFYSVILNQSYPNIEVATSESNKVYLTYQLPKYRSSSPTVSFKYYNDSINHTFYFNESTGITFTKTRFNISFESKYDAIQFNIYIMDFRACNYSFLTLGNMEYRLYPYKAGKICVFPHNIPRKVKFLNKREDIVSNYAYIGSHTVAYSPTITDISDISVLVADFKYEYSNSIVIYDSTDRNMDEDCEHHSFMILNDTGLIPEYKYFDGYTYPYCLEKSDSLRLFLIIFFSIFGVVVITTTVLCIVCCCCLRPRSLPPAAQPTQVYVNYPQYAQPAPNPYANNQAQNPPLYTQPLLQNQQQPASAQEPLKSPY